MFQRFQEFVNNAVEIIAPHIQTGEEQLLEHWLGICDVYRAEQRHVLDASVYVTRIPDHLQGIVKCVKAEEIHRRKIVHANQDNSFHTSTVPLKNPSGLYSTRTSVSSGSTLQPTDPTMAIRDRLVLPTSSATALVPDLYIGPCLEAISAHRILNKLVNFAEADRPRGMRLEVIKFFIQFLNVTSSKCIPDSTVRQPLLRLLRSVYVIIMNPRSMETNSNPSVGPGNFATLSYSNASQTRLDQVNTSLKQDSGGRSSLRRGATIGSGVGKNRARPSIWTAFDPPISDTSRNMSPTVEYLAQTANWDNTSQELSPLAPLRRYGGAVDMKRRATLSHKDGNRRYPRNQQTEVLRHGQLSHHSGPTTIGQESLTHQFMLLVHTLLKHICRQPEMLDLMVDWGTVNPAELPLTPVDSTSVGGSAGWSAQENNSSVGYEKPGPSMVGTTATSRSSGTPPTTTARIIVNVPQPDNTPHTSTTLVDAKPLVQVLPGHHGKVDNGSEICKNSRLSLASLTNDAQSVTSHNRRDPQCFLLDMVLKFLQEPGVVGHLSREGMILALETVVMDPRLTWLLLHHVKFVDTLTEHLSYLYAMMPYHKYATETSHDSNIPTALEMEPTKLPAISTSKELGSQTVRHMHTLKASAKEILANIFSDEEVADMPSLEGDKGYGHRVNRTMPSKGGMSGLQDTKGILAESDLDQESSQSTSGTKGHQAVSTFFHFWRLVDQLAIICESHPQVMVSVQNNIVHAFLKPTLVMAITSSTEGLAYTATQYTTELIRSTRCALLLESIFYALLGEDLNPERSPQPVVTESRTPNHSTNLTIQTDTKAPDQVSDDTSAPRTPLDNDAFLASALNISMDTLSMSAIAEDWMKSVSLTQDGVDSEVRRASSYLNDVHKPISPSVRDLLMGRLVSPNERLRIATLQLFDSMLDTYHQFVYISLVLRNFMTPGSSPSRAVTPLSWWRGSPPPSGPDSLSRQSSSGASVSSEPRPYSPQWPEWDEAILSRLEKQANDNCIKNAIVERFLSLLPDTVMGDASLRECDPLPGTLPAQSRPGAPFKRHSPHPPVSALEQGQEDYVIDAQTKAYAVQRAKSTWLPWETLVLRVAQYDPLTASVSPAVTSCTSPASSRPSGDDRLTPATRLRSHSQVQNQANVDGDLQAQINDLRIRALSDTHLTMESNSIAKLLHTTTGLTNPSGSPGGSGATEDPAKYSRTFSDLCLHPMATATIGDSDGLASPRTSQYVYPGAFLTALLTLLSQHLQHHMVHNLLVTGLLVKIIALDEPAINWYMFCACRDLDRRLSHLATEPTTASVPSPDSFSLEGTNQMADPFVTSRGAATDISTLQDYNNQNTLTPTTAYLYDTLAQVASEAHQLAQTIPHFGHRLQLARQLGLEPQKLASPQIMGGKSGRIHPTAHQSTMLASARSNVVTSQTLNNSEITDESEFIPDYKTLDDGIAAVTSTKEAGPCGEISRPVLSTSVKRFVNAYIVLQEFCKEIAAIALVNHLD